MELYNPMGITENDVVRALTLLYRPCHAVNALCQEGIEHAIHSLECGWYRKKSMAERLFLKPKIKRDPPCMRPDFLSEFTSGVETFWQGRTEGLEEFNDEETNRPSHVVFIVIFNKFMCYAVAQEVRNLILLVDSLPSQGTLTRNRILIPKFRNVGKRVLDFFRKRTSLGAGTYEPLEGFGRAKRTVEICHRLIHRNSVETDHSLEMAQIYVWYRGSPAPFSSLPLRFVRPPSKSCRICMSLCLRIWKVA